MLALAGGGAVRKDVRAVDPFDRADMAADIPRQPGVALRMDVAGAHALADLKPRGSLGRTAEPAARHDPGEIIERERAAFQGHAGAQRVPRLHLVGSDQPMVEQHLAQAQEPLLVVACRDINGGRQALAKEPRPVDGEGAGRAHGAVHRHHAAFPRLVEHRFVSLGLDLAVAVHAAHVMNAVHGQVSDARVDRPVPIMLSRVTMPAS